MKLPTCPHCADQLTETWRTEHDDRTAVRTTCTLCGGEWQFAASPAWQGWKLSIVLKRPVPVRYGERA